MEKVVGTLAATLVAAAAVAADFRDFIPEVTEPNTEAVEWTVSYAWNTQDKSSPRVLLIGDSICNGYQVCLRKILAEKANVSFWASSYCVTHPQYLEMLDVVLRGPKPDLILFNNGLHTPKDEDFAIWKAAYARAIAFMRARFHETPVAAVTSTPLKDDADGYVNRINAATAEAAESLGLEVIDLHGLCAGWNRETDWCDRYHFQPDARERQSAFLAQVILRRLPVREDVTKTIQQESEKGPDGKIK